MRVICVNFGGSGEAVASNDRALESRDGTRARVGYTKYSEYAPAPMKLARLVLSNYRGFEALDVTFDPRLTLLVGKNGSGKSSVLDAITTCAFRSTRLALGKPFGPGGVSMSDVRGGATSANVISTWLVDGTAYTYEVERMSPRMDVGAANDENGRAIPIVTFRVDRARAPTAEVTDTSEPVPAWDDGYFETEVAFDRLVRWMRSEEDLENQERVSRRDLDFELPSLGAVRRACRSVLGPEYSDVRIDRSGGKTALTAEKGGARLTASQLSDGERNLLGLAANLARRLVPLAPAGSSPVDAEAVVLIDEVELHLHPSWQETILPRLLETFPHIQIVATTHSPSVLASIGSTTQVRVLDEGKAYTLRDPVTGRDANALLRDVFGARERPRDALELIELAGRALDAGALDDARVHTDTLEALCGPNDSEVVRLRLLLDFERA